MKTNFVLKFKSFYTYLNILFVLNLDNPIYKDFAYTRHERIFEVLIYWIDIESHFSRPEMMLIMTMASSIFMFVFRRCDFYIFPLDSCENQNIARIHCCDLASKT